MRCPIFAEKAEKYQKRSSGLEDGGSAKIARHVTCQTFRRLISFTSWPTACISARTDAAGTISLFLPMKRKLNQVDLPVEAPGSARQERYSGFEDLKLEARLLQAIAKENFRKPTPIQAKAIPLALAGKDILGSNFLSSFPQ